jgi:hypothetical protein
MIGVEARLKGAILTGVFGILVGLRTLCRCIVGASSTSQEHLRGRQGALTEECTTDTEIVGMGVVGDALGLLSLL